MWWPLRQVEPPQEGRQKPQGRVHGGQLGREGWSAEAPLSASSQDPGLVLHLWAQAVSRSGLPCACTPSPTQRGLLCRGTLRGATLRLPLPFSGMLAPRRCPGRKSSLPSPSSARANGRQPWAQEGWLGAKNPSGLWLEEGAGSGSLAADATPREAEECWCKAHQGGPHLPEIYCFGRALWDRPNFPLQVMRLRSREGL